MNWEMRKYSASVLKNESTICLDSLRKITGTFSRRSQPLDQDKNPELPECDAGVLPTQTRTFIGVSLCFLRTFSWWMITVRRVLENLIVYHLAKKLTDFCGIQKFVTVYSVSAKSSPILILLYYDTSYYILVSSSEGSKWIILCGLQFFVCLLGNRQSSPFYLLLGKHVTVHSLVTHVYITKLYMYFPFAVLQIPPADCKKAEWEQRRRGCVWVPSIPLYPCGNTSGAS